MSGAKEVFLGGCRCDRVQRTSQRVGASEGVSLVAEVADIFRDEVDQSIRDVGVDADFLVADTG